MPHRHRSIRRIATLTVAGGLALGACGSDESSSEGGDVDQFCTLLAASLQTEDGDTSSDPADVQQLADNAPEEIADDMNTVAELVDEVNSFDFGKATDAQMEAFEPKLVEFDEASTTVQAWAMENCENLPVDPTDG